MSWVTKLNCIFLSVYKKLALSRLSLRHLGTFLETGKVERLANLMIFGTLNQNVIDGEFAVTSFALWFWTMLEKVAVSQV